MSHSPFTIEMPGPLCPESIELSKGQTLVFVGANGGGKTRLAVKIENDHGERAHRVAAHRALALNPEVQKIPEEQARQYLRTGGPTKDYSRQSSRWNNKEAIALLNDFDYLMQALFAEQTNVAYENHKTARSRGAGDVPTTKLEDLVEIWHRLLPQRRLLLTGDDIRVEIPDSDEAYSASDMSDGERAVFYLVGQALMAAPHSLLIFDEPELHIHRSISSKLWDEIEAARPDCAFVVITHDLEFAASIVATKYVIRDYSPTANWTIEPVPEDTGFDEEITTAILGSRRPVLFVEGAKSSLDFSIFRACYPEWTVIPRGSCEEVIHAVVTMRKNQSFTRLTCAGILDADDQNESDIHRLGEMGIEVLPVSEIENMVALPEVSKAIAEYDGLVGKELQTRLDQITSQIFSLVGSQKVINRAVLEHCRGRVDRAIKLIDLRDAKTSRELEELLVAKTWQIDGMNEAARLELAVPSSGGPATGVR